MPLFERILVTGARGDIAQSVGQIICDEALAGQLVGADVRSGSSDGQAPFEKIHFLPTADDPSYGAALSRLIGAVRPDLLIPMSEAELAFLLESGGLTAFENVPVLAANPEAVRVGLDKLRTTEILKTHGIPMPWTGIVGRDRPPSFPCIVKPRRGQGSKRIEVVDAECFAGLEQRRAGDLVQQFLPEENAEHTCGLYRTAAGEVRSIVFCRTLRGGLTGYAELVINPGIDRLLRQVADALALRGAINVQLRLDQGRPMIFEINARFSSTVGFRHAAGFTDVVWAMRERCGQLPGGYRPPLPPLIFERPAA